MALWLIIAGLAACGDESGPGPAAQSCDPAVDERGRPVACIAGAIVGEDGAPVVGVNVAACTKETCIVGKSSASGEYLIQRLPVEPHKVEVLGVAKGYMSLAFFQDVLPGELARAARTLVLPRLTDEAVPWPAKAGGVATTAKGRLVLTARPDTLRYPIGTPEEEMLVEAAEMPVAKLVPYDVEPWKGKESKSLAFIINPFPLTATDNVAVTIKGAQPAANALYSLYAANTTTGKLEKVGILAADGSGDLVLQPGATLTQLTTLVAVPN